MKKGILLASIALISMTAASCGGDEPEKGGEDTPEEEEVTVESKTPGTDLFYKGSTMCFASYMQDLGLSYKENGAETDPYVTMKNHGATCVRLQLDQVAFSKYNGATIDWQTYSRVLADAKKAQAQGLEIFLTMKPDYDVYTDDGTHHNILPPAWSNYSESQIGQAIYDWTYSNLENLAKEGIYPAIVAVGNEVNVGFCRPSQNSAADNSRTGRLLVYGHKAVRDYAKKYNPACLSAVHIADPSKTEYSINAIEAAGATDYDIVAVSYYPGTNIGHSMPTNNFQSFAKLFPNRKIMVVETAYSFTTGTVNGQWMGDYCNNAYNYPDWDDAVNAVNYTPAKARAWLAALAADVKAAGGVGLITWGTESLPDELTGIEEGHGKGLYTYPAAWAYGSTWENNSYWDFTNGNNVHEGIDWMKDVN